MLGRRGSAVVGTARVICGASGEGVNGGRQKGKVPRLVQKVTSKKGGQ